MFTTQWRSGGLPRSFQSPIGEHAGALKQALAQFPPDDANIAAQLDEARATVDGLIDEVQKARNAADDHANLNASLQAELRELASELATVKADNQRMQRLLTGSAATETDPAAAPTTVDPTPPPA